jgi:hypothetical protein
MMNKRGFLKALACCGAAVIADKVLPAAVDEGPEELVQYWSEVTIDNVRAAERMSHYPGRIIGIKKPRFAGAKDFGVISIEEALS